MTHTADSYAVALYALQSAERSLNHALECHQDRPCALSHASVILCCQVLRRARAAYHPAWIAYCSALTREAA